MVERQNVDTTFCHCQIGRMTQCRKTKGRNEPTAHFTTYNQINISYRKALLKNMSDPHKFGGH